MFPHGAPGIALLLLRISVAATFLISAHRFGVSSAPWLFGAVLLICISLSIGFLTPILSVVVCIAAAASALIGTCSWESAPYFLRIRCCRPCAPGTRRLFAGCALVWAPRYRHNSRQTHKSHLTAAESFES